MAGARYACCLVHCVQQGIHRQCHVAAHSLADEVRMVDMPEWLLACVHQASGTSCAHACPYRHDLRLACGNNLSFLEGGAAVDIDLAIKLTWPHFTAASVRLGNLYYKVEYEICTTLYN